jgi:hypothetical protein
VGNINVDVSLTGYTLNFENYRAEVEDYICRGEVLDWQRLIWNFGQYVQLS